MNCSNCACLIMPARRLGVAVPGADCRYGTPLFPCGATRTRCWPRAHGHRPSISTSSEKLRNVRINNRTVYHVVPDAGGERWVISIERHDSFREEHVTSIGSDCDYVRLICHHLPPTVVKGSRIRAAAARRS
jgi:hypothetical protein